jgi:multiple sugar transport system permease protein
MPRRSSLPVTFVVPTLAILLVLSLMPTLYAIVIALQNRELSSSSYSWVWFSNFTDLFLDRRFLNAVWVSVKWEIVTVVATMVVAIGLGVLMFEVASPRLRNI